MIKSERKKKPWRKEGEKREKKRERENINEIDGQYFFVMAHETQKIDKVKNFNNKNEKKK